MSDLKSDQHARKPELAWHRHPALIAGIPAVAAVLGSAFTIGLGQAGALPEQLTPAPAPATVTAVQTVTATVSSPVDNPTSEPSSTTAGQVVWKDELDLPRFFGVDIDEAKPAVLRRGPDTELYYLEGSNPIPNVRVGTDRPSGTVAVTAPTYDECANALNSSAAGSNFPSAVGSTFCIRSNLEAGPRLASFRILTWDKATGKSEVEVTVWTTG